MNGHEYYGRPYGGLVKDIVSSVCTAGSVLLLVCNIISNYIQNEMNPAETILHDPLSFIFTLLPVGVSTVIRLSGVIKGGFRGLETVAWVIKPLLRVGGIFICLILIIFLDWDVGLEFIEPIPFFKKFLVMLGFCFLSSACFAYLDGESVLDYLLREAAVAFAVLCIVNGCVHTAGNVADFMTHGESLVSAWISGIIIFSLAYIPVAAVNLLFSIVAVILLFFGISV